MEEFSAKDLSICAKIVTLWIGVQIIPLVKTSKYYFRSRPLDSTGVCSCRLWNPVHLTDRQMFFPDFFIFLSGNTI